MTRRAILLVAGAALAVALGLAALLLGARGGGAPGGWRAPVVLPAPADARVGTALQADGTLVAVWTEERRGRTAVLSSELPPGGDWTDPATIQPPQAWDASAPAVAVGPGGDAVAVWSWYARSRSVLMAARRPAGGAWEAPQAIAPVFHGVYAVGAAVDPGGGLAIAFGRDYPGSGRLAATIRRADAAWGDGEPLPGPGPPSTPAVAIAPGGQVFVATVASGEVSLFTHGAATGDWVAAPAPRAPVRARTGYSEMAMALDDTGRPVVAWTDPGTRGAATLWSATWTGAAWIGVRALDRAPRTPGSGFGAPAAAQTDRGVMVAWSRWTAPERAAVRAVVGADAPRTVAAITLPATPAGRSARTPGPPPVSVLAAQGGTPALLWTRLTRRTPLEASALEVSEQDGAGAWSPPEDAVPAPVVGHPLAVGHAGDGMVAAWIQWGANGAPGSHVLAAQRGG